jgi:membrane protein
MNPRYFAWLLRRSVIAAAEDNCFGIAKGAAYSALLSFFPVLTSAATLLLQTRADYVSRLMERVLARIVPPGSEGLVVQQFRVTGARPTVVLIVANLISLWAASSVIKSLIEGFQAVYRIPNGRGFWKNTGLAVVLVAAVAIPLLSASLLVLFGSVIERQVLNAMKVDPLLNPFAWVWAALSRITNYVLAFVTTVLVTALLYYFAPYRRQQWRYVWPGAILATVLWMAATSGFGWYVRHIGRYNVMYGSIGAGIALLVWMYLLAAVALIGCEFNAEYERMKRR